MKKELMYNGKRLPQMTAEELREQLQVNKKRSVIRAVFLLVVTVAAILAYPISATVPVICLIVTQYWIMQNNKKIKSELESRNKI